MIGRRGFLAGMAGIIAAGVAPAIVKQPMKIYVPPKKIITPLAGLGADFDGDVVDWMDQPWVTTRPNTGEHNPLHFGNMAWKPELQLVVPIDRSTRVKELVVQPAFKHVSQLPIMGLLDVRGKRPALRTAREKSDGLLPLTGLQLPKIKLLQW